MKTRSSKPRSIMKKIMIPMMFVLLLQVGLFLGTVFFQGTITKLNHNSMEILNERVINRKNYIESEMIHRWSKLDSSVQFVNNTVNEAVKRNGVSSSALTINSPISLEVLDSVSDNLINLLRKQSVTGVFVIFNGEDNPYQTFEVAKTGLYIRDSDPISNAYDNSDLMLERAPSVLTQKLGIPMDSNWQPKFLFSESNAAKEYDFFYRPLHAAIEHPQLEPANLGYWSKPFCLNPNEESIITYSVPLIDENGTPYGVLGIEISSDYLKKNMPYGEITADNAGTYMLVMLHKEQKEYENLLSTGSLAKQAFGNRDKFELTQPVYLNSIYEFQGKDLAAHKLYGCIQSFELYNVNTPFYDEHWALMGVVGKDELLGFSNHVTLSLIVSTIVSFIIGLFVTIIMSSVLTDPISALVRKVKESTPHAPVKLDRTNILEIDELASAVETLNKNVAESASKLSKIIEMTSISIGAFEYNKDEKKTFYTEHFFQLLGIADDYSEHGYIDHHLFTARMHSIDQYLDTNYKADHSAVYMVPTETADYRWVRITTVEDDRNVFGVAEDITQEILEKKKLEHDRDYDFLTNLLNRRAFIHRINQLFHNPPQLKIAAMVMLDLDNLKYINDTYGHDCGDQYIRSVADALRKNVPTNTVLSRMSGDEFYLFLYGYESRAVVFDVLISLKEKINMTYFPLEDDPDFHIRASFGVSWYPKDATSYETLIRYADFAMYIAKNTAKGELKQFDAIEYTKNSYLFHKKEEFNKFIDQQLVEYYFQPIVDARTGKIFAYEALMRSKLKTLKSPFEILTLARTQSKLYQIEQLTWFNALKDFIKQKGIAPNCKLFINSIANQCLSDEDIKKVSDLYSPLLSRLVIELTEEEKQNDTYTITKQKTAKSWNAQIALDDFGAGYNGEVALLYLSPDYVKVDMSIVRNIDQDENRQKILHNLISYSRERKIQVIAEGVETREEMETLVRSGVNYLQGYYIGHPNPIAQKAEPHVTKELAVIYSKNKKKKR